MPRPNARGQCLGQLCGWGQGTSPIAGLDKGGERARHSASARAIAAAAVAIEASRGALLKVPLGLSSPGMRSMCDRRTAKLRMLSNALAAPPAWRSTCSHTGRNECELITRNFPHE